MAKVIAGDWPKDTPVAFLAKEKLLFQNGFIRSEQVLIRQITAFDIITEENRASILGKVGWGALGAVTLGPLGLLAGVLGGGNRRDRVFSLQFKDGRKALIKGTAKDIERMQAALFGKQTLAAQVI